MSHIATNWAFEQTNIGATEFRVLAHLADCHNPAHGCFPSQALLAARCECARSTINANLKSLEAKGLIKRDQQVSAASGRQLPTRYILGFEIDKTQDNESRVRNPDTEAVSDLTASPCPIDDESRVRPVGHITGKLTSNRTSNKSSLVLINFEQQFWPLWKSMGKAVSKKAAMTAWHKIINRVADKEKQADLMIAIISGAKRYRDQTIAANTESRFIPHPATWLHQERWLDETATSDAVKPREEIPLPITSNPELDKLWAKVYNRLKYHMNSAKFSAWVYGLYLLEVNDDEIVVAYQAARGRTPSLKHAPSFIMPLLQKAWWDITQQQIRLMTIQDPAPEKGGIPTSTNKQGEVQCHI